MDVQCIRNVKGLFKCALLSRPDVDSGSILHVHAADARLPVGLFELCIHVDGWSIGMFYIHSLGGVSSILTYQTV